MKASTLGDISDDVLKRFCEGEVKAFEEVFNYYWKSLYKIALYGLRSHEEAEEVVQELFSNLWQQRGTLKILNLSAYLTSAVRRRVIDCIRAKVVHDKYWQYYKNFIPNQKSITDESISFTELNEQLEKAIGQLPAKSQLVFRLNRLEGKPVHEIAKFLKISERAIEYHITKSLRVIKSQLKDFVLLLILTVLH